MSVLTRWMQNASPEEKRALADLAGTTVATLRQTAGAYRRTNRIVTVSAEFAGRLETASRKLQRPGLPVLRREDLCPACGECQYLKMCRKGGFTS